MVERLSEALIEVNKSGSAVLIVEQEIMAHSKLPSAAKSFKPALSTCAARPKCLAKDPPIRQAYLRFVTWQSSH